MIFVVLLLMKLHNQATTGLSGAAAACCGRDHAPVAVAVTRDSRNTRAPLLSIMYKQKHHYYHVLLLLLLLLLLLFSPWCSVYVCIMMCAWLCSAV